MQQRGKRQWGLTLVEVMVSVVILVLILGAGMSLLKTDFPQISATVEPMISALDFPWARQ